MGEEFNQDAYIDQLHSALDNQQAQSQAMHNTLSSGLGERDPNIIQYQIDSQEMLEKLERFYRGEHIGVNDKNEYTWIKPSNKELVTFNDFGVNSMMEIITKYFDKNTILSEYSEERIYEILADLGDEICLFMYCNYEQMGMDSYFKKTKFRIIILTTLHVIESTYRRAHRGNTRADVNQHRVVTQTDIIGLRQNQGNAPQKKGGFLSWLRP